MSTLVTGATGSIGRLIVNQLITSNEPVRVLTRRPADAKFPSAVRVFGADLTTAPPSEALHGVKQVFLFPASGDLGPFLEAVRQAKVEHLVVLSSLAAAGEHERDRNSASAKHHLAVEAAAKATGITTTVLRPGNFANNLRLWAHSIKATGGVIAPWPNSAQTSIHEADIADAAIAAMRPDFERGQILPMSGPESLSRADQLQTIARALGQPLTFTECTPEAFAASMAKFIPADIMTMLLRYWSETAVRPERVVSHSGRTLAQWATDHVADFR